MFKKLFILSCLTLSIGVSANTSNYMGLNCDDIDTLKELKNIAIIVQNKNRVTKELVSKILNDEDKKENKSDLTFELSMDTFDFTNFALNCKKEIENR